MLKYLINKIDLLILLNYLKLINNTNYTYGF